MYHFKNFLIFLIMVGFFISGCSSHLKLISLDSGNTLEGRYDSVYTEITVTMPNGEILTGKYRSAKDTPFPSSEDYEQTDPPPKSGFGSGIPHGIRADVYALLKSEKTDLMMEVFLGYDSFKGGDGFGFARTNDKRSYKIKY
ncbi:MAG: hypothetical protein C0403_17825 [Desulfobacterium sp.]|nr:hypothetical protein [Desulfobacterium sp.]